MMGDLFDNLQPAEPAPASAHARHEDPDTSHEAAEAISPRIRELQARVLRFAEINRDGFTDRDLEQHFLNSGSTYRTRRAELTALRYIEDSGERRTHGTSNRRHIVWRITAEGRKAAQE